MLKYSRFTLMSLRFWWKIPASQEVSQAIQISRHTLYQIQPLQPETWGTLRSMGLLKRFRGTRYRQTTSLHQIKPRITTRSKALTETKQVNFHNLINIQLDVHPKTTDQDTLQRNTTIAPTTVPANQSFAVPKFLFTNICSLTKTKNRVRAPVALETDLHNYDVDVCVVSETHLKPDIPDTVVNISNYTIYRRDRNWSGNDSRCKGGVAIYVRSNLKVNSVYRSNLYELITLNTTLPSGHNMIVCGLYHPPKFNYNEQDLLAYITELLDNELDKHPNTVIVLGGDLNKMNVYRLEAMSGLKPLVDFPTRGNSCLDNCLTNRDDLFGVCYPIQLLMRTDHKGVILPPGIKLKPIRFKVQLRDLREHRKQDLYLALLNENWDDVTTESDINTAVNKFESKILCLMDKNMPVRTITMSTRDPPWMSPLLKVLLRDKSRIPRHNLDQLKNVDERIRKVISENRRERPKKVGCRSWWQHVDSTSHRRSPTAGVSFGNKDLDNLNEYFSSLCTDDDYTQPQNLMIDDDLEIPCVTAWQVWNCLSRLKKTSTGPDSIPYWLLKEHAEILAPVVATIWNLSLLTHTWPSSWKRANINPLPKVDIPKSNNDYRGISVTPVIARAFERLIYHHYVKDTVEDRLGSNQFAYRQGGNCTNALLSIQHRVYEHLDDPSCTAVRMFAMDFSKAFDSVKHDLLSRKLKTFGLNAYVVNWYLEFLNERKQRVVWNNIICKWKSINKGTVQGSVSGPYLFILFLNDLNISYNNQSCIFKYADDSTLISPVYNNIDQSSDIVNQFLTWTKNNSMSCNPSKCKELVFYKKGSNKNFDSFNISGVPQCKDLPILGLVFEGNCRFSIHVRNKLVKANKCLHILRCLRKEGYNQNEIDHLFLSIVLPNLTYGLSVYAASSAELTSVQAFLDRCFKRRYTSQKLDIRNILEKQDTKIYKKASSCIKHPLHSLIPKQKTTRYNLRRNSFVKPRVNTHRFQEAFFNRLIFKYNLLG